MLIVENTMTIQGRFYKSLPIFHALVHISEFACVLALLIQVYRDPDLFFSYTGEFSPEQYNSSMTEDNSQIVNIIGYAFYLNILISSCTVLFVAIAVSLSITGLIVVCCLPDYAKCMKDMLFAKSFHRFLSLNCNCPCYRARPQLRFKFRFVYLIISACLRVATSIGSLVVKNQLLEKFAIITAISFGFLIIEFLLDFYHYRVLWHYKPAVDEEKTPLSKKHRRYLLYQLTGANRTDDFGNRPCRNTIHCKNRKLEHIMIFHARDYHPQPRWSDVQLFNNQDIYIGFHQTDPIFAVKIAHSDFNPSMKAPQMLGFGIYFARSISHTFGKARKQGAFICAEIRMGRVKEVVESQLREVSNSNAWWDQYDTVYYKHVKEERDEFCIKSSSQIIRWVMTIAPEYDTKIEDYGLDTEFDNTKCGCC